MGNSKKTAPIRAVETDRESIRRMFARIAPRYDLLNWLLSAGRDQKWRARAVEHALDGASWAAPGARGPIRVLDTCAGTGDLALAFARALAGRAHVVACDYTLPMLDLLAGKGQGPDGSPPCARTAGDSLALPFRPETFHVVSAAFGVRNVAHGAPDGLRAGLLGAFREMERVLRPGGRAVVLEFSTPSGAVTGGLVRFYFQRVLPRVGNGLAPGQESAYRYLPSSVEGFPDGEAFLDVMREAGLRPILHRTAMLGLVSLYLAEKADLPAETPRASIPEGASHGAR